MTHEFSYHAPGSIAEALALLAEHGDEAAVLSGGTDLLVNIRSGLSRPRHVVDIKRIPELKTLSYDRQSGLRIGACVTMNELLSYAPVTEWFAVLQAAGVELATYQLRNRATPVGNIVTASPCGDMSSPLLCLDAEVLVVSQNGSRQVPVREFITGVQTTALAPDELVQELIVPRTYAGAKAGYKKLKRIKGHDLGVVSVALITSNGTVRVGIGSAAPTPLLLPDFACGTPAEEIQAAATNAISPIDDVRCTKEYRAFMVGVFIGRLVEEVGA